MPVSKNVDFIVESIKQEDRFAVLSLLHKVFSYVKPNVASYVNAESDWHESVLVRVDGKIVGCYMLKKRRSALLSRRIGKYGKVSHSLA